MTEVKRGRSAFLAANLILGSSTIVRFAMGIAKTKLSAAILGPAGVGVVGLGVQLETLGCGLATTIVGTGLSTQLSIFLKKKDEQAKYGLLSTAFTLLILTSLVLIGVGFVFERRLAAWAFGDASYSHCLVPIFIAIPLHTLVGSFFIRFFYCYGELKYYARASMIAGVVEAVSYIILVRYFGPAGAFWGIALGMSSWLAMCLFFSSRFERLKNIFKLRITKIYVKELVVSGFVMSAAGSLLYLMNALVRIHIIRVFGAASGGIYQVVLALSAYYLPYLTNGVWARLNPKVSAEGLGAEVMYEWTEALCLIAILAAAAQLGLMWVVRFFVSIVYTKAFLDAVPIVPIQLLGDFFYLIAQPALGVVLGLSRMRTYFVVWVIYIGTQYGLTLLLSQLIGLRGVAVAYLVSNLGLACYGIVLYAAAMRRQRRKRILMTLAVLGISGLAVSTGTVFFVSDTALFPKAALLASWGLCVAAVFYFPRVRAAVLT
ncbi:MAG: hypothetical protein HY074_20350 [Deltaproteobacteria bacterium]|nr:hypothetical protein [Deltaproteobacteria bacterium]